MQNISNKKLFMPFKIKFSKKERKIWALKSMVNGLV